MIANYSQKALNQLENGQLDNFKKYFEQALCYDDSNTLYSFAEELYSLGFLNQAKQIYENLLANYPKEDDLRVNLADIMIDEDDMDGALNYLNQVSSNSSAYIRSLMVTADLYQTQELFEVSEQKLIYARKLSPEEPAIKFALAELYLTMREYSRAIPLYLSLIKQGITTFSGSNLVERLGIAYANDGRFEQAIGYLKQVHEEDMTSDVKFETGFTYLQLHENKLAINFLEELRETEPQYTSLYPYLGEAYEAEDRLNDSLRVLQEGLRIDQYNERLWSIAADIAVKLNNEELAESYLKKGTVLNDEDLEIVIKLSNLYVKQKRYNENIVFLLPYVNQDNIDPQIYWNLARSYEQTEIFVKAQQFYEVANTYFQNDPNYLKQAIFFFKEQGEKSTCEKLLRRYLEIIPDDNEMALELENIC